MVAGGLAGATPHMISATVTAVSRLVFEFKGTILMLTSFKRFADILPTYRCYFPQHAYRNLLNPPRFPYLRQP